MFSGLKMRQDAATQMEKRCLPGSDPTSERSFELDVRKPRNQKRCNDHQYAKQPESSFVHTGANVMYTTFPFRSTSNSGIVKRFPFSDIFKDRSNLWRRCLVIRPASSIIASLLYPQKSRAAAAILIALLFCVDGNRWKFDCIDCVCSERPRRRPEK
ncbi:uncharacterized protein LOC129722204 [Wyeomyia smithii]|uniref:uncharacterized protein LOC129722204 n=1 Tax=Wyeomyia smithii TaxID=174621 RepID=UPI002467E469|nr:uncharacterized protein LOC129722204 [Wyeomyia smithii]